MKHSSAATFEREVELPHSFSSVCEALSRQQPATVWLDGGGGFWDTWSTGPLLGVEPRISMVFPARGVANLNRALARLEGIIRRRRQRGGTDGTGLVLLLAYEALDDPPPFDDSRRDLPRIVALEVDRSLRPIDQGRMLLSENGFAVSSDRIDSWADWLQRRVIDARTADARGPIRSARVCGRVRRRFSREQYVRAVQRIKRHIECGDVYQANLCQHYDAPYEGDEFGLFLDLAQSMPAPRSAFLGTPAFRLASVSPEIFLRGGLLDGRIETWPIKGTRSRRADPEADLRAAEELMASPKDRAELLMIVDLERNDLGRVCQVGSISVRHLASLRSFSAVHHLVACVEGRLQTDARVSEILRATFPGGSISGAPKIRARQILADVEGVSRGYFTGALCWIGDDGTFDSSILIRTLVFAGGRVHLGAGGGIVADSDPEQEWMESILKARAPAAALGFSPQEAH